MSHYSVAVITDGSTTVEELLAPYDENIRVDPYINRTKEQMIREAKKHAQKILKRISEGKTIEEIGKEYASKYLNAQTDEDFYNAERYADCEYDEDGNELTTYNPDSKWDWYSIGGRFPGLLKAKKGEHGEGSAFKDNPRVDGEFDVARIGDIDFSPDQEAYEEAERLWEIIVEGAPLRDGEEQPFMFYKKEYYMERYHDKATFAKASSLFSPYACITPDGVWHSPGDMGWFGCSNETHEAGLDWQLHFIERFIDTADPDWEITMVDCHI